MVELRSFVSLGGADHGWLKTRHHFSFAGYHDPQRTQWGLLRVWNDDEILPNKGFPTHPHADMEIITYVRAGAITHQDSLGNRGRTQAGDVQVMSAGTGIQHSEFNLESEMTSLFQIWILPTSRGGSPSWGTQPFPKEERAGQFVVLASGQKDDREALVIRSDARVLAATVGAGQTVTYQFADKDRYGYLVPAQGNITVNGVQANTRDGVAIYDEATIKITANTDAELILVDTAGAR